MRLVIGTALKKAGHTPVEAANGREALRRLSTGTIDLIITDILMPERDGIEMLMNLRQDQMKIPVIAITGVNVDSALYLKVAKNLGAVRTLAKPFGMDALLSAVNEVLAPPTR